MKMDVRKKKLFANPTSVATAGPKDCFGDYNGEIYVHKTGAKDTNWELITTGGDLSTKADLTGPGGTVPAAQLPNGTALAALATTEPAALEGTALTDADATIQPFADAVSQYQDKATLTTNRTTTLGTTSAVAGMIVRIVRAAGLANTRTIAGASTLFVFPSSATKAIEASFMHNGAYWIFLCWRYVRGL